MTRLLLGALILLSACGIEDAPVPPEGADGAVGPAGNEIIADIPGL